MVKKKCNKCSDKYKPNIKELIKALDQGLSFPDAVDYANFDNLKYSKIYNMLVASLNDENFSRIINKISW